MDTCARTALSPSKVSIRNPTRSPSFRISAVVKPRMLAFERLVATRRTTVVFPAAGAPVRSNARGSRGECRSMADRRIEKEKDRIREEIWSRFEESGEALFPGARGRIPNFRGAAAAAERLAETPEWRKALTIKCNRIRRSGRSGSGHSATERRSTWRCPGCARRSASGSSTRTARRDFAAAATISRASRFGRSFHPRELPHIDLVVAGSVAVNRSGARLGKGGGYSDLEYVIGRTFGTIDGTTRIATTVHPLQLWEEALPMTNHDFFLDLIAMPEELLRPQPARRHQPRGVIPEHLTAKIRRDVPVLADLEPR